MLHSDKYEGQVVVVESSDRQRRERYDYLILATGNIPTCFGNETFRRFAFELHSLEDSVRLRNHILQLFEEAVWVAYRQNLIPIRQLCWLHSI